MVIVCSSREATQSSEFTPCVSLFAHSEEVFDYSAEQMTQAKTKNLKNQMCGEFSDIFQLCLEVLEKANKPTLIRATLRTLLRFLNWIPLGYIFETNVIEVLRSRVCSCVSNQSKFAAVISKAFIYHILHGTDNPVFGGTSFPQ